ncbi:MAG: HDIG domain-containing protein [Promethearchaeota archaeon]|nr:MAG: HDIG domain-containing protein [Candidatus Lokiarchaeota archaeon]
MVKEKAEELPIVLPDRDFALELLKKLKVPYSVRRHSLKVCEKALEIANKIRKANIDINLIEIGAILHDIGRSKTHGFQHALLGGKILRGRGFPNEIARICETHILGGLDKEDAKSVGLPNRDYLPETLEEKIVCLADKSMAGRREVSIDKRFQIWFAKYGKSKILLKSKKRIKEIQKEIQNLS